MKRYLALIILLLASWGCSRPQGFTLKKILSKHPNDPRWDVSLPNEGDAIQSYFLQPYTYLGSGNHCYAFKSEDGQYVLKFFKQKHMRTQSLLDYLPLPAKRLFYPMERIKRRTQEREESFTSYKIAYEHLQKETGVIFLHLNKTEGLLPTLSLVDQQGQVLEIPLDNMEFLLQKKATLAFKHFESLFNHKEALLDAVESLLRLIATRNQKGIFDKDLQFYKNFGFSQGEALEVDVGEFKLDEPPRDVVEETQEVSLQIRDFIQEHASHLLPDVQKRIEETLKTLK